MEFSWQSKMKTRHNKGLCIVDTMEGKQSLKEWMSHCWHNLREKWPGYHNAKRAQITRSENRIVDTIWELDCTRHNFAQFSSQLISEGFVFGSLGLPVSPWAKSRARAVSALLPSGHCHHCHQLMLMLMQKGTFLILSGALKRCFAP